MNTTHDLILLGIAGLYSLVGLARAILARPRLTYPKGWFAVPFLVAFAAFITAVLW